jgi:hypothetical protein
MGKPMRFEQLSDMEAQQQQVDWGAVPELIQARLSIFRAIREGRLQAVTQTVHRVLGRPLLDFEEWVKETLLHFGEHRRNRALRSRFLPGREACAMGIVSSLSASVELGSRYTWNLVTSLY